MSTARNYLDSQIRTASPQRLRKMLIDGAIRYAGQVHAFQRQQDYDGAYSATEKLRMILDELLNGIKGNSEIANQSKSIYGFLLETLTKSRCGKEAREIGTIIEVLKIEQETWDLVCQKHPETLEPMESSKPIEITVDNYTPIVQQTQLHKMTSNQGVNLEC